MPRRRKQPNPIVRGAGTVHYRSPQGVTLCGHYSGDLVDRCITELDPETVTCSRCLEGVVRALSQAVETMLVNWGYCPECGYKIYFPDDVTAPAGCLECGWREP